MKDFKLEMSGVIELLLRALQGLLPSVLLPYKKGFRKQILLFLSKQND